MVPYLKYVWKGVPGSLLTFSHVFFLLKDKHVMIKKLLQFLVAEIDAQLLKSIVIKNLKASNIQHSNELNPFHCWIHKGFITLLNNKLESSLI